VPRNAGKLTVHFRYVSKTSHRLARELLHAMAKYGPALDKRQIVLGHLMDIGTELFAMASACSFALSKKNSVDGLQPWELADLFCRQAQRRIADHFSALRKNDNKAINALAKKVSAGEARWLEDGIMWVGPEG
jgi:hypothetical protein